MKLLTGFLIVANCLAFQLLGRGSPIQHTAVHDALRNPFEAPTEDKNDAEFLRGKLAILHGVIKELGEHELAHKERIVAMQSEHAKTVADLEEQQQNNEGVGESRIELLELISRLQKLQEAASAKVETMTSQLGEKDKEVQFIQNQLDQKEGELEAMKNANLVCEQQLSTMKRLHRENEELETHKYLSLETKHLRELEEVDARIQRMEKIVTDQRKEMASLKDKIKEDEARCTERVEIATAAVEAAEKRANNKVQDSERQRKRSQVQMQLQRLVLQGLLAQLKDNSSS